MNLDKLLFKKLDFFGLQTLVSWAQEEGWNPGRHDAQIFWDTDPDGFYGYYDKGILIAGGSIVSYKGNFGFMGFFIVKVEFRSQGIGRQLWQQRRDTLLSRLKPSASVGMDGVLAMQKFYQKGGFEIAFRDERYEKIGKQYKVHKNISTDTESQIKEILAYDKICFGYDRTAFMCEWLKLKDSTVFTFNEGAELKGFAMIRKVAKGYKVCPLFAETSSIANELYKACLNAVVNEPLYIDIPCINKEALLLIKKHKCSYVFECARMYYGKPPKINMNRVYGITTFELG